MMRKMLFYIYSEIHNLELQFIHRSKADINQQKERYLLNID